MVTDIYGRYVDPVRINPISIIIFIQNKVKIDVDPNNTVNDNGSVRVDMVSEDDNYPVNTDVAYEDEASGTKNPVVVRPNVIY